MPRICTISYNTMIYGCFSNGKFKQAQQLFDEMSVKDLVTCNIMIRCNIKKKDLGGAGRLFDEMLEKDVVSWSTILYGHVQNGLLDKAKRVCDEMLEKDVVSWGMILYGYVQNGFLDDARRVFDEMPEKDVVSWSMILSRYAHNGFLDETKRVFDEMPMKNVVSWTTMITGYARNDAVGKARDLFDRMPLRNCFSWAAIIAGYDHNGDREEALWIFAEATRDQRRLGTTAFATALSSCAKGGLEFGRYIGTGLVSMYCRCIGINKAYEVFERIGDKNVISWTAIIFERSEIKHCIPGHDILQWHFIKHSLCLIQ